MEQLIFIAIVVIFSILDSVARTNKKKRQGRVPVPAPKPSERWEPDADSYDTEPSYDEVEVRRAPEEPKPLPRYTEPYGSGGAKEPAPRGSEGMIPSDLWEEIAGLARGRLPQAPAPPPKPAPKPAPARYEAEPTHQVHKAHAGYGTDPSSRPRSREDGLDPLAGKLGVDAESARHQLLSRDRHALRQAVILQEILGRPAALREDTFEE